jgi:hypothetical protein
MMKRWNDGHLLLLLLEGRWKSFWQKNTHESLDLISKWNLNQKTRKRLFSLNYRSISVSCFLPYMVLYIFYIQVLFASSRRKKQFLWLDSVMQPNLIGNSVPCLVMLPFVVVGKLSRGFSLIQPFSFISSSYSFSSFILPWKSQGM